MTQRLAAHLGLALALILFLSASVARADEPERFTPTWRGDRQWVADLIVARAEEHGANASELLRVASCEAPGLNPGAVGRAGELGLFQLHPQGLLPVFFALGYSDPFDAWQAADFAGWAFTHGLAGHWSCWRLLYGW